MHPVCGEANNRRAGECTQARIKDHVGCGSSCTFPFSFCRQGSQRPAGISDPCCQTQI
jgi:hypothetical protein